MSELTSTAGIAALIAGAIAVVALFVSITVATRLKRVREDQRAVIGDGPAQDLVGYTRQLEREIARLSAHVDDLGERTDAAARRLDGAITHTAVVRYDAYDEMTGRQSSSIALLDEHRNGVVVSSILRREQARLYAKSLTAGRSEIDLSPEEQAAVDAALGAP